jgi:hypothetical protein
MVGSVRSIPSNLGSILAPMAAANLCKNPQCDKDPDTVFVLGQPGKRKPPVRKTLLPSRSVHSPKATVNSGALSGFHLFSPQPLRCNAPNHKHSEKNRGEERCQTETARERSDLSSLRGCQQFSPAEILSLGDLRSSNSRRQKRKYGLWLE